ncbi:MAG: SLC13 family permease, partial [Chloroflexi bacterium]|nr:SLC13 family permease [Chloroflexota bacterium]
SVLTVGVLFVVAVGMYSTGAINRVVDQVIGLPRSLGAAFAKMLPFVSISSAFLNNTPLVAMMVPVVRDLARGTGLPASKLYLPVSFASILGGAATLIGTSTNLIIAGMVAEQLAVNATGAPPMRQVSFFDPALVGVPAAVVGLVFMTLIGSRILRSDSGTSRGDNFRRVYRVEFQVKAGGPLVGKSLQEAGLTGSSGLPLLNWQRADGSDVDPATGTLEGDDRLAFCADTEAVAGLWSRAGLVPRSELRLPSESTFNGLERFNDSLVEAVISRGNPAVGRTVCQIPVESGFEVDMQLIGASRDGRPTGALDNETLRPGDVVALEVAPGFFFAERRQEQFLLTKRLTGVRLPRTERATVALVITAAMVAVAAIGIMSMLNAALLAVAAMLIFGCVSYQAAFKSVEWDTLVVLACAIGLEAAITASGLSAAIGSTMADLAGDNPYVALGVVFVGAIVMTNLITNAAAAAFMFPIALSVATALQVNFMPFVIVLMLGTSYAFINPAGYQTNLMVYGPGGYTFGDFARIGIPLTIIVGVVAVALAPIVFGF